MREVYQASYRRLVVQLVGLCGDVSTAEEVVQEVFTRAWRQSGLICWVAACVGGCAAEPPVRTGNPDRLLPVEVETPLGTGFADAASAWCPTFQPGLCAEENPRATIASVGAEARLVAALGSWDQPFAFRLGVAVPVVERERASKSLSVYFTSGLSF